ncbi:unnamed protein product [Phytomonas sp. Hart1]|nr:unnamed protein product [Phytomonas sp. Hart1]|eukprot:CCW69743.1 unnamed protein product [Phytomonas sp. isolate Hart1]
MIQPYLWIVIFGIITSFLVAYGNGANDLSNAFGTSYGSRVLTLTHIIIIATFCEFGGAALLGSKVSVTMSSGIASASSFTDEPYVLMYGFLCTLGATFLWLIIATWKELSVSSHQSVAGGILGFALVYGGFGSVHWAKPSDSFPYVTGVVPIVVSWIISPILTGAVAMVIYCAVRYLILERKNAAYVAPYTMPVVVFVTCFMEFVFIFLIAASSKLKWSFGRSAWVAAAVSGGIALLSIPCIALLQKRIRGMEKEANAVASEKGISVIEAMRSILIVGRPLPPEAIPQVSVISRPKGDLREGHEGAPREMDDLDKVLLSRSAVRCDPKESAGKSLDGPTETTGAVVFNNDDTDEDMNEDHPDSLDTPNHDGVEARMGGSHAASASHPAAIGADYPFISHDKQGTPHFDPRAEYMFRYLQVFTAACTSLAHGANDVSNAIGPLAAIWGIYTSHDVSNVAQVKIWMLCLGGIGIVVGLATFGMKIMRLLGEKIAVITPFRGFSAELATAMVVSFATMFGIPISSTHCITGAVVAVSMIDVGFRNVRWKIVLRMYAGWVTTLFFTALISAIFFAQGINSPTKGVGKSNN